MTENHHDNVIYRNPWVGLLSEDWNPNILKEVEWSGKKCQYLAWGSKPDFAGGPNSLCYTTANPSGGSPSLGERPAPVNRLALRRLCCRVSGADKGWPVYPLDPHPDAVALYSGWTPGKRRAWVLSDDWHTLVGLRVSTSTQANLLTSTSSTASTQPNVPLINTATAKSNSRTSAVSKAANNLNQNKKNGRMLTTEPQPEIEIQMRPHISRNKVA
ncbi:hypothetical protein TNCV_1119261 [Trichonephila clavipes]|uniref:Uncharacterized protein n=1 Tax=Trichonephila clavipes TaxID=2585209 RepID=A0A8X6VJ57_TRICX|nr:hypothetical protein TNCV_1119261 [Trichonephila clavipes]